LRHRAGAPSSRLVATASQELVRDGKPSRTLAPSPMTPLTGQGTTRRDHHSGI
jgi:hypothetical protein